MIRWKNFMTRLLCAGLCLITLLICISILVPDRNEQTHPIGDGGALTILALAMPLALVYFWVSQGAETKVMTKLLKAIKAYTTVVFIVLLSALTSVFARWAEWTSMPTVLVMVAIIALPEIVLLAACVIFRKDNDIPEL